MLNFKRLCRNCYHVDFMIFIDFGVQFRVIIERLLGCEHRGAYTGILQTSNTVKNNVFGFNISKNNSVNTIFFFSTKTLFF